MPRGLRPIRQPESSKGQITLPFPDAPGIGRHEQRREFREPPFHRKEARAGTFQGISPREGFAKYVVPLLARGHTEEVIDGNLVRCITTERWWIKVMLDNMQTGAMRVIDEAQRDNAVSLLNVLDELSELAVAWWYYELNVTAALRRNTSVAERWRIGSDKIRSALGRLRSTIASRYAELTALEIGKVA